jgi:hypothetical protein
MRQRLLVLFVLVVIAVLASFAQMGGVGAYTQQRPRPTPTPTPDPIEPFGTCWCDVNPCCVPYCPTCCGGQPCRNLTDAEVAKFSGKRK